MLLRLRPLVPFLSLLVAGALFAQQPDAHDRVRLETAAPADVKPVLDDATAAAITKEGLEHSQVMRLLTELTSMGHRLTGSDNFDRAADWAVAEFTKMGLQHVHKEKWGEWNLGWNRGTWKGRITSPIQLDMYVATEAWTASTNGPRQGRVLRVPKTDEEFTASEASLKGAWLYAPQQLISSRSPARMAFRKKCEDAGILGWLSKSSGDAKYPTRVRVFGDHHVAMGKLENVPTVPQVVVQSDHAAAIDKLLEEGKDVTVEIQVDSTWKQGPIELDNIVAELPGTGKPDEVVIVCGHFDCWHQAQGCTDNGTGTTSTMEAARILARVGARPERTIRFILWGGEEEGLLGSVAYVRQHRAEMDKVSCVFNHDTGTNWAQRLSVTAGMYEPMRRVFLPIMKLTPPDADFDGKVFDLRQTATISGGGGSDHASFIAARVPGLDWGLTGRSDYFGYTWHSQWDKIDVAIPEYQRHTSTVVALAALGVADLPELLDHGGVVATGRGRQSANIAGAMFGAEFDNLKFTKVEPGGTAAAAGIAAGDVIVKVNGGAIAELSELVAAMRDLADEDMLALELKRGDGAINVKLKVGELRAAQQVRQTATFAAATFGAEFDGLKFTKLEPEGSAQKAGIQVGDVIVKVDGKGVASLGEVLELARSTDGKDTVELELKRGDAVQQVKLKLPEPRGRRGRGGDGGGPGGRRGDNGAGGAGSPGGGGSSGGSSGRNGGNGGGEDGAVDVAPGDTGGFRWGIGISTGADATATLPFDQRRLAALPR